MNVVCSGCLLASGDNEGEVNAGSHERGWNSDSDTKSHRNLSVA